MSAESLPDLSSFCADELLELADEVMTLLAGRLAVTEASAVCEPFRAPARAGDWGGHLAAVAEDGAAGPGTDESGESDGSDDAGGVGSAPGGCGSGGAMALPVVATRVERVARGVERLRTAVAGQVERVYGREADRFEWLGIPEGKCAFRDSSDYLRQHLRITRREARQRLRRASELLPGEHRLGQAGQEVGEEECGPRRPVLAQAVTECAVDHGAVDLVLATLGQAAGHGRLAGAEPAVVGQLLTEGELLLTGQARVLDPDTLRRVCARWLEWVEALVNPDGDEPSEAALNARMGLFYGGRRAGLHRWSIAADELGHEILLTVANAATNPRSPRAGSGFEGLLGAAGLAPASDDATSGQAKDDPGQVDGDAERIDGDAEQHDCAGTPEPTGNESETVSEDGPEPGDAAGSEADAGTGGEAPIDEIEGLEGAGGPVEIAEPATDVRSRARRQLDGLVSALQGALTLAEGNGLPAAGGLRPQVLVTIDYQRLLGQLTAHRTADHGHTDHGAGQLSEAAFSGTVSPTTVRTLACDAQIIPAVLGAAGEVLDLGRSQRLFPPRLRRAVIARDGGCSAPGCSMPAPWCQVHHVNAWEHGGPTSVDNGALLCTHHHHAVHAGAWQISMDTGRPWFTPAPYLDPHRRPQRNRYWRP